MVKFRIYKILNISSNFKSIKFTEDNEHKNEDVVPQENKRPFLSKLKSTA
jgi:hypothetical protein